MVKFPRFIVFIMLACLLIGTVQPVSAMTEAKSLTAEKSGKSMVSSDLGKWKEKLAAYKEQTRQGAAVKSFYDTAGHWAEASIRLMQGIGLCNGFPDGNFHPDSPLTQLEAISLLMPLANTTDEKQSFHVSDQKVAAIPAWGQSAVRKATLSGVVNLDEFDSSQPVNRALLAEWLVKTVGLKSNLAEDLPFEDAFILSSELTGYIMPLYQQGIMKGYPDHKLHLEQEVSRAEMTMMLTRLLGEADTIQLNILSVNDFHGSLPESGNNPGAAKLAAYLMYEKAQNPEGTLLLSAGDMMQGSADSNLLNGEPVIDVMNQIGFDAMTIGNHEFDWGVETLQARAEQASFPFLTANVSDKMTGQALTFTKPYIMTERAGVKIGIIGLTTPETAGNVLPSIISAYEIADPTAIVNSLASELRQKGAKIIIVVGHLGAYAAQNNGELQGEAAALVKALKGVDVLVTGHTHQTYAENINGVAVVQAAYNGRAVAKVQLSYSPEKVSVSHLKVIDLKDLNLSEDASVKAIIDAGNEEIGPIKNRVIGKNNQDLPHNRYDLSPLGQWVTDSVRQAAKVEVFFINGGALRTNIPAGDITVGKLWEVLPFDDPLCVMSMTGMQIKQVLQHGIKNQQYGMVQFSGLRIQYNGSLEADKRITKVTLADGTPLQEDKTYRVATNDFMTEGGDGFTMFKQCPDLINTQEPIRNILIDYIEKMQSIHFTADDRLQE